MSVSLVMTDTYCLPPDVTEKVGGSSCQQSKKGDLFSNVYPG
jgi:hypothetical protein